MRVKRASLVINPRTGQNVAKINDVLAIFAAAGWKTEVALKEYGGHTMELAEGAAREKRNLVIAYGGDGTLNQVVNGVMNKKGQQSIVGVIPGGTANVWAGEIGVPVDPIKAALSLVNSETRRVDIGHVDIDHVSFTGTGFSDEGNGQNTLEVDGEKDVTGKKDKAKHHFLLMSGLGIDAAIMGGVSKPLKYRLGTLAVGLSAMKELPTQRSFPIEIGTSRKGDVLWRGEALQVVIGNTRHYADITEMTPNAYIDDGVLDVCVITAGDPLTTMQQLSSLVLRRKPDNLTAEYFHGACLYITVPASVPMQLDGSGVKLKDYLKKSEYVKMQQEMREAKDTNVMVTYRFESMPRVLDVAIPRNYDDALFIRDRHLSEVHYQEKGPVHVHARSQQEDVQTDVQRQTEAEESLSAEQQVGRKGKHRKKDADRKEVQDSGHVPINEIEGRSVTVIGKTVNPEKESEYIIAGSIVKQATGELRPVAVVVNKDTCLYTREGMQVSTGAMREVQAGMNILVEGKKSKRGVIVAKRLVM